ncbi:MAG: FAD-binding oxidoreductase, partial [Coleofasciculaceae cyanobacterium SM2_3_26]|nr:FAD-binding oxidoreductase [Coleofasciculaceae cyanobacterium SM2_3_26]
PWNRILPVGDSSSNQSPLSFGGFGAMVRHLPRLHRGIHEALLYDALSQAALAQLHPYQPNLSVTWLFQRTMSVGVDQSLDPDAINRLMNAVFLAMEQLGDPVLKPFLQDVVQFGALSQTLSQMSVTYPNIVTRLIPQVGLPPLMDWMRHYLSLGVYSAACPAVKALQPLFHQLPPLGRYYGDRLIDALSYGSGADYRGHEAP